MFENHSTRIFTSIGPTEYFHPRIGVEQRDPMSPTIWNIYYEIMLRKLNLMTGFQMGDTDISYLAYADDVILISENFDQMQALTGEVNNFLKNNNMKIQSNKTVFVSKTECLPIKILNEQNESKEILCKPKNLIFRYLGAQFCLKKGNGIFATIFDEVDEVLEKIS